MFIINLLLLYFKKLIKNYFCEAVSEIILEVGCNLWHSSLTSNRGRSSPMEVWGKDKMEGPYLTLKLFFLVLLSFLKYHKQRFHCICIRNFFCLKCLKFFYFAICLHFKNLIIVISHISSFCEIWEAHAPKVLKILLEQEVLHVQGHPSVLEDHHDQLIINHHDLLIIDLQVQIKNDFDIFF